MIIRLDKFISRALLCSRKEAKDFIVNCLNKKPNDKIDSNEIIEYNGQKLIYKEHYYIVMNKPEGVVSATEDSSFLMNIQNYILTKVVFLQKI